MMKELLAAVSAYNLVRAVMCMAARRSRLDPRRLSFTQVLNVVDYAWHNPNRRTHQDATRPRIPKSTGFSRPITLSPAK